MLLLDNKSWAYYKSGVVALIFPKLLEKVGFLCPLQELSLFYSCVFLLKLIYSFFQYGIFNLNILEIFFVDRYEH